jgi:hypothetical protein
MMIVRCQAALLSRCILAHDASRVPIGHVEPGVCPQRGMSLCSGYGLLRATQALSVEGDIFGG